MPHTLTHRHTNRHKQDRCKQTNRKWYIRAKTEIWKARTHSKHSTHTFTHRHRHTNGQIDTNGIDGNRQTGSIQEHTYARARQKRRKFARLSRGSSYCDVGCNDSTYHNRWSECAQTILLSGRGRMTRASRRTPVGGRRGQNCVNRG